MLDWDRLGWVELKRTFKGCLVQSPAMDRNIFHYPRLLQALPNLVWNTFRDGTPTVSLGNNRLGCLSFQLFFPCYSPCDIPPLDSSSLGASSCSQQLSLCVSNRSKSKSLPLNPSGLPTCALSCGDIT